MNQKQFSTIYGKSRALVIGINRYKNDTLPPLETAESGAIALVDFLIKELNFLSKHVILLQGQQATKAVVESVIEDHLTDPNRVGQDDRLLIYYAGHGITRARTSMGNIGYIAPFDAEAGLWSTFIEMDEFIRQAAFMPAKHVLFLLDACFSGLALMRGFEGSNESQEEFLRRPARQIITAGTADQMIADRLLGGAHSIFTYFLLRGLRGHAVHEGALRASHLGLYLQDQVSTFTNGRQIPQVGRLVGDGGGDFVFRAAATQKQSIVRPTDLDPTRLRPGVLRKDDYEPTVVTRPESIGQHLAAIEPTVQTSIAFDSERATLLSPPNRSIRAKRRRLFTRIVGFW